MNSTRDVVITGLGMVSPIGIGAEAFARSLRDRTSGVRRVQQYDTDGRQVHIGGELEDFQPKLYVKPRKSLKVMSHEIQMGVASAVLATEDARLDVGALEQDRLGVVYGSPTLYADVEGLRDFYAASSQDGEFQFDQMGDLFPNKIYPLWMLKFLPNMPASHIGIAVQARGPNNSVVCGDVSSLLAIIEATTVIQRGLADVMFTGGTGSRLCLTATAYRGESNLSRRNADPAAASRPFDADRDGMVIGEAASTLVLETREHAEARGAEIYGTIAGYASTHSGSRDFQMLERAVQNSIRLCLGQAKQTAADLEHINANGTGELDQDAVEARAIHGLLGDVPVTAPKSYFGNVGAGTNALELSASLLARREGAIPPTLNYETPDPNCPVNVVRQTTRSRPNQSILKLSQARTGQAVALLVT